MRALWIAVLLCALPGMALAADNNSYHGLSVSTPYPAQIMQYRSSLTLPLSVHNFGLPPQTVRLRVLDLPKQWQATFEGSGREVGAVFVDTNAKRKVSLHLSLPPEVIFGHAYGLRLLARGSTSAILPIDLTFAHHLPARLALDAELPTLKGSPSATFKYHVTLHNESARDLIVSLAADTPSGFQASFTPQYGSQNITSVPVKAGASKDLDVQLSLPDRVKAGTYPILVHAIAGNTSAQTRLAAIVTGRPRLSIDTPDQTLSGDAYAGHQTPITLILHNNGSAAARGVDLSATDPTHWKVSFSPQHVDLLPAHGQVKVTALLTPAPRSLAGDYMVTFNADSGPANGSADYRVTVLTSTLWGLVGVLVIAAALAVLGFAVARFGRR